MLFEVLLNCKIAQYPSFNDFVLFQRQSKGQRSVSTNEYDF